MATALTQAQRERKNELARARRASKAGKAISEVVSTKLEQVEVVDPEEVVGEIPSEDFGPVVTASGSPSAATIEILDLVPRDVPETQRTLFAKTLEADLQRLQDRDIEITRELAVQRAAVINAKRIALRAKKGDVVVFPGNAPAEGQIAYVHRDGGRLITADGFSKTGGWCEHTDTTDLVYYEYVGGPWAGEHGWVHGDLKCRRIAQSG